MQIIKIQTTVGDFDLDVKDLSIPKKIIGLIGPNGSGKTTLAKSIMDMIPTSISEIENNFAPEDMAYLSQRPYIIKDTVIENITYPLKIRNQKVDNDKIDQMLEKVSLLDKKHQYAPSLSSGEQQKLSFIRGLIYDPKFIIVDETFSNMDTTSTRIIMDWILEIQKASPRTWLIISHQLAHIKKLTSEIIFMDKGKVYTTGPTDQIFQNQEPGPLQDYLDERIIR